MALDSSCFQRLLLALAVTFRGAERLTWGWGRSGLGEGPSVHRGQWLKALSWGGGWSVLEETLGGWRWGGRAPGHRAGTGQRPGTQTQRAEAALCPVPKEVARDRHTQLYC